MNRPGNTLNYQGQALVEIVVALTIFFLFAAGLASMAFNGFAALTRAREYAQAGAYAQAGSEILQALAARAWDELDCSVCSLAESNNSWHLEASDQPEQIGEFKRTIHLERIFRDDGGNVVAADYPGAYEDVLTREATVKINWPAGNGRDLEIERSIRLKAGNIRIDD